MLRNPREICAAACVALACASCSFSSYVAAHPVEYNAAAAEARDKLILLNILRAAQGYPMQFSALSQVRGNLRSNGELSIGGAVNEAANDTLTLGVSSSIQSNPSFDVSILDTAKFMRGILTPVSLDTLHTLADQGWRSQQLAYLLVEEVRLEITTGQGDSEKERVWAIKNNPRDHVDSARFARILTTLLGAFNPPSPTTATEKKLVFTSSSSAITPIIDNDVLSDTVPELAGSEGTGIRVEERDGGFVLLRGSSKQIQLPDGASDALYKIFGVDKIASMDLTDIKVNAIQALGDPITATTEDRATLKLVLRSPHSILIYLAELAKTDPGQVPKIRVSQSDKQPLFDLITNSHDPLAEIGRRADDDLDPHFSVPFGATTYSLERGQGGYRSRRTLALVSQLLALQQDRTELPTTSVVNVTGG